MAGEIMQSPVSWSRNSRAVSVKNLNVWVEASSSEWEKECFEKADPKIHIIYHLSGGRSNFQQADVKCPPWDHSQFCFLQSGKLHSLEEKKRDVKRQPYLRNAAYMVLQSSLLAISDVICVFRNEFYRLICPWTLRGHFIFVFWVFRPLNVERKIKTNRKSKTNYLPLCYSDKSLTWGEECQKNKAHLNITKTFVTVTFNRVHHT